MADVAAVESMPSSYLGFGKVTICIKKHGNLILFSATATTRCCDTQG